MSFAAETKEGLCGIYLKKACCRRALLCGILTGTVREGEDAFLSVRNSSVSRLAEELLREFLAPEDSARLPAVPASGGDPDSSIRFDSGMIARNRTLFSPEEGFRCQNCIPSFLRGVFLVSGSVSDPRSSYHLDFSLDEKTAKTVSALLEKQGLAPRQTVRRGETVLYYKGSESIEDVLTYLGATKSSLEIMNAKIYKDLRNSANRLSNCEMANIGKSAGAAAAQLEAIRYLRENGLLNQLPEELRLTAVLRDENPDLPLRLLAELHNPPLTKSGMNHRLCKILDYSNSLRKQKQSEV